MKPAATERLCVHTATTRPLAIEQAVEVYATAGVAGITVWRDALEGRDPALVGERIRGAGLTVVSLCRGGFFVAPDPVKRRAAVQENERAIGQAAALGAPHLVLVCGSHPTVPLATAREQIRAGVEAILPAAEEHGVRLAVEPLHPMYAADRSAINTMRQANELCETVNHPMLGVAVDVYHLFWDPDLETQIGRCGRRIFAFHVSDWRTPTRDLLNDRGLMGEGCIPIREIRGWAEAAGFRGFNEVEIFSTEYWSGDQTAWVDRIVHAYHDHV